MKELLFKMLKEMAIGAIICSIFCIGMYAGCVVYKLRHPEKRFEYIKEYEVVGKTSTAWGWYNLYLYDAECLDTMRITVSDNYNCVRLYLVKQRCDTL